jgi:hypothetical protein
MNPLQVRLQRDRPILRRQDHRRFTESRQRRRSRHGRTSSSRNKHSSVSWLISSIFVNLLYSADPSASLKVTSYLYV